MWIFKQYYHLLSDERRSDSQKRWLDIFPSFSRRHIHLQPCLIHEFLNILFTHFCLFSFCSVWFVSNNDDFNIILSVFLHFLNPSLQVSERILPEQVENQYNPICATIVSISYCSVSLLACCVPLYSVYWWYVITICSFTFLSSWVKDLNLCGME